MEISSQFGRFGGQWWKKNSHVTPDPPASTRQVEVRSRIGSSNHTMCKVLTLFYVHLFSRNEKAVWASYCWSSICFWQESWNKAIDRQLKPYNVLVNCSALFIWREKKKGGHVTADPPSSAREVEKKSWEGSSNHTLGKLLPLFYVHLFSRNEKGLRACYCWSTSFWRGSWNNVIDRGKGTWSDMLNKKKPNHMTCLFSLCLSIICTNSWYFYLSWKDFHCCSNKIMKSTQHEEIVFFFVKKNILCKMKNWVCFPPKKFIYADTGIYIVWQMRQYF